MTKRQREAADRRKNPSKKSKRMDRRGRKNPAYKFVTPLGIDNRASDLNWLTESPFPYQWLQDSAGTLLVNSALAWATFQEKAIIAGLIPLVLPILRKHGTLSVDEALNLPEFQRAHAEEPQPTNDRSEKPQQKDTHKDQEP